MLSLILLLSLIFSIFMTISSRPSLWKGGKNDTWAYINFTSSVVWLLVNIFTFIYIFEYPIMIQTAIKIVIDALPFMLSCFMIFYISKGAFNLIRFIIDYFYTLINNKPNS